MKRPPRERERERERRGQEGEVKKKETSGRQRQKYLILPSYYCHCLGFLQKIFGRMKLKRRSQEQGRKMVALRANQKNKTQKLEEKQEKDVMSWNTVSCVGEEEIHLK